MSSGDYIKPIETLYKGYRFRSRLEARWAVFFDELGIEYQYEPQGFEFDGERYLPDFFLPQQRTWVETKPKICKPTSVSFYLAGPIDQSYDAPDWRKEFVQNGSCKHPADEIETFLPPCHIYTGPFFCDNHGCIEGDHGIGYVGKEEILKNSLRGITLATTCFAWINRGNAFGTFVELGYAKALKKKIIVCFEEEFYESQLTRYKHEYTPGKISKGISHNDLWFIEEIASSSFTAKSAREAFNKFLSTQPHWSSSDELFLDAHRKIKSVADGHGDSFILICGDPWECDYVAASANGFGSLAFSNRHQLDAKFNFSESPEIIGALSAARAARFEHGAVA